MCNKNLCGIVEKRNKQYNGSGINGAIYSHLYRLCCRNRDYEVMTILTAILSDSYNTRPVLAKIKTIKEEFESL